MSDDFYLDDLLIPAPKDTTASMMWPPVRRWERLLRVRCRSIEYIPGPQMGEWTKLRCERRAGHDGGHALGGKRWGWVAMPNIGGSRHFNTWAQTCPLNEWVEYGGRTDDGRWMSAQVFMTQRPEPLP